MQSHYDTLGVPRTATEDEIKAAYRRLSRKYHPDVSVEPDANERFQEISVAYAVLMDAASRARYDETGQSKTTPIVAQSREIVCGLVLAWVQEFGDQSHACSLTSFLHAKVAEQQRLAEKNVTDGENIVAKFKRTLGRLKFKGTGHDYVRTEIESRIGKIEAQIVLARENVERMRLVLELSRDYDYESPFGGAPAILNYLLINRSL